MGSPPVSSDISFPSADLDEDLNSSGNNVHLEVDPVSSEVAATQKSKKKVVYSGRRTRALTLSLVVSFRVGVLQNWLLNSIRSKKMTFSCRQNMDMSNPAAFVNAELLHFYVGRRVRALMQVVRSDGGVVIGKSTDEKQVVVKGAPPAPLTTFVEVFGIVNSDKSIAAEIWTNFGDSIDMFSYNKLCQLANGELRHLFL
ncbi:hypothetical protein ACSQ67_001712 [Phaseolus vulgaris]